MNAKAAAFFRYPLVWAILGFLLLVLCNGLLAPIPGSSGGAALIVLLSLLSIAAYSAVYLLVMKKIARRPVPELSTQRAGRETLLGIGTGLLFIGLSVLVIAIFGGYSFRWAPADAAGSLIAGLVLFASAALFEEMIFRGLLLQAIERIGGSWIALAATSLFFGAVHLANPSATLLSAAAIAVEAGLLLGAAFLWRRNLWFVTGLHFAWNASESLLGIQVSGLDVSGLFEVRVGGSAWLTGGDFGLEGSLVPVAIGLLLAVFMLSRAKRAGQIKPMRR
ncbi:CPBP family intramembrane metalloprotease [Saccharibacillus sp. CPCC 101409]|uniref:CPBP family intramembrane glutamic endopeptidase n=1 Tax=Saccharibacillus sp. CPCC 101409 TaxID=3058041 RepID=UPI002671CB09|nr:CPBP family intramembrane glutamic endopeptidase [Saccharibacillus sp. CPCC 101409]MDO3411984.1 CPBP family intramembrane metalloprotease [Saccharibacillus sp. CPCC 101409]